MATIEDRLRELTPAKRDALVRERGPSVRQRTEDWTLTRGGGDLAIGAWDWTKMPLRTMYQMRSDPMISFGLAMKKVPLVRAPWYIECKDARIAAFVDNALRDIWTSFVLQWTNSFDFGFAPLIKNFKLDKPDWTFIDTQDSTDPEKPVWDEGGIQAVVWKAFTGVAPEHAEPEWTESGEFDGFKWAMPGKPLASIEEESKKVPVQHALWATYQREKVFGSLYGETALIPAWRFWWSYWFRWSLGDRAFEKNIDPSVVVWFPPERVIDDATDEEVNLRALALSIFEQARAGSTIALPNTRHLSADGKVGDKEWEFEQMKMDADFAALHQTFNYLDVLKLRSMSVPEQALIEGGGGTSSRNVAAQMGDVFWASQAVVLGEIVDQVNKFMIPQLVAINFPEYKGRVCMKHRGFASTDVDLAKQIFQLIGQADPTRINMVDLRELLGQFQIPLRSASDMAVEAAEQAAAEAAAAAAAVIADTGGFPEPEGGWDAFANGPDAGGGGGLRKAGDGSMGGAKRPTNEAVSGGKAPATRGVLAASDPGFIRDVTDEHGHYVQPRERIELSESTFRERMQRAYPMMEDPRYIELAADIREEWVTAFSLAIESIAAEVEGMSLADDSSTDNVIGTIDPTPELLQRIRNEAARIYAKYTAKTAAKIITLMASSGRDAAIKAGFLPAVLGTFDQAEKWAEERAREIAESITATTVDAVEAKLRDALTADPSPKAAARALREWGKSDAPWKAERVSRAESLAGYRMGQLLAAKAVGADKVRASDASDGTNFDTDPHCIDRHGQEYTIDEAIFESLHRTHPNCTLRWEILPPRKVFASDENTETRTFGSIVRSLFGR